MRGGWPGKPCGLDDETPTTVLDFLRDKAGAFVLKPLEEIALNPTRPLCNEFGWMIFLEMTFLYHVMYRYMTITLGNVRAKGNKQYVLFKGNYFLSNRYRKESRR